MLLPILATFAIAAGAADYRQTHPLPGPTVPDGWGVNIHFTSPLPGEMEKLAGAGFKWVRMDLFWHTVERQRGVYNFREYDNLILHLERHKIRPLFILCYGNDLYQQGAPRSPEARAAFARFAGEAVKRYRGRGVIWEIWNEPNIHFWSPRPDVDEYVALAQAVSEAVRREGPDEWLVGPALSGFDWPFFERCFEAGLLEHWDAITVHPYRNSEPESASHEFFRLRELIDRYKPKGKNLPILSGEWGYSERYPGIDERRQADYILRQYLSNLANGVHLSIWYDWRNDGEDPNEVEHHFGTVFRNLEPKQAYNEVAQATRLLRGFRFNKRIAWGDEQDYFLLFQRDQMPLIVAWTTSPEAKSVQISGLRAELTDPRAKLPVRLLQGRSQTVTLHSRPQYLAPNGAEPLLTQALATPSLPPFARLGGALDLSRLLRGLLAAGYEVSVLEDEKRVPATSPEAAVKVLRRFQDRAPQPIAWVVEAGKPGAATIPQRILVHHEQPVSLSVRGLEGGQLIFEVEAGTGSFNGILEVSSPGRPPSSTPVAGTGRFVARANAVGGAALDGFTVRITDPEGRQVMAPRRLRIANLERFASEAAGSGVPSRYRLLTQGDPKVVGKVLGSVEDAPAGAPSSKAIKIDYDFPQGWQYLLLMPIQRTPLPGRPVSINMWVHGDGSGFVLRARVTDATGQTFQPEYGRVDWTGWRFVSMQIRPDVGRWGGANDGVIHYPLILDTAVLLDSPGGRGGKGTVYVTDIFVVSEG
jgi:polysaccharide biosynthesis protein PslG